MPLYEHLAEKIGALGSMRNIPSLILFAASILPHIAHSQSVTESWLRTATTSCGAGLNIDVQGEFETEFLKRLDLFQTGIEGEGQFELNDVQRILGQFEAEGKERVFVRYVECLLTLTTQVVTPEGIPPKSIVLDVDLAPPALSIVPSGKRFTLAVGDLIAFGSSEQLITLTGIDMVRGGAQFRTTNTLDGTVGKATAHEGEIVVVGDCNLPVYHIDRTNESVSLFSVCN